MIRAEVYGLLLCAQLMLWTCAPSAAEPLPAPNNEASGAKKPITLDDVLMNALGSDSFNGSWMSDTEIFYRVDQFLVKLDVTTQKTQQIAKNALFEELGLEFFTSPDNNYVLVRNVTQNVYRHSALSIYSIYSIESKTVTALADGQLLSTAFWAPQGSALAYVLNNDVYYHQVSGKEQETRRLTFDGKPQVVYNGMPDWVYEEEVYGTDRAMWFSTNGEHLAFATFNDSQVPELVITRYGEPGSLKDQYPKEKRFKYPKAGRTNPQVTLNVIDLTDHGSKLISLKPPVDIVGSECILFAVTWFDAKTVAATWTNRVQNLSQLVSYSLTGQLQPLLVQKSQGGWLLNTAQAPIHHDSYVFLHKLQSVTNASLGLFNHATRFRLLNGVLDHETDLTPGEFWVHDIHGVNEAKRALYVTASPPGEPSQKHLYEIGLAKESPEQPKCITCQFKSPEGNACRYANSISFSTNLSHYVLTCAGPDPATIRVYDLDGSHELYTWSRNDRLREVLATRIMPKQMDLYIESHGFDAKVRMLVPPDLDKSKKYPMLINVYAGPSSQAIIDNFALGLDAYLSTSRNVIYAWIDGRGSSTRGTSMMYAVYRQLGSAEMEDQLEVAKKLQHKFPWIDSNKTALWGWSYGGYSTVSVLTKDDDNVFSCGLAVAPVTNWIYYDSIYTERYMALPTADDNLKGYESSSVVVADRVKKLKGKKFLLIHGTGDDNVHYQQSMALTKALAETDILYNQDFYADEVHSLSHVGLHLVHTIDKFWSECLGYHVDEERRRRRRSV
ncbi:venom dipeptidyl peptidase 4-like isoform X2 [Phymastichus coffea]|uniref:venom dipeptidyl peptidase 4-like isoform X2 n=1 Tax=Phymastichus coffea TaxID=108790 RepID=UPI00273CD965|nr:venom dipeptidyl peptidase 4-like isoform X2 [Phymastichus coffea]